MALEVISANFLALIQDFGRYGQQKNGITHGGPLDEQAYLWANRLLQNHYNDAQLEISLGAFSARFTQKTMIAVCGADLSITLNDQPLALWRSHAVNAGDVIKFVSPKMGLRSYLAVKGGVQVKPQLGSCATVLREGLGGLYQRGTKLSSGDTILYGGKRHEKSLSVPLQFVPHYSNSLNLRFIENKSDNACSTQTLKQFLQQSFKVTPNIDRMGYKLEGKPLETSSTGIISQGTSLGAIQLPKDGQPIVLMRDRQTMGGYPQLGCVAYLDVSRLAQAMPGTEIRFIPTEKRLLESELITYKRFFKLDF